jgi:hypothetical protein
VARYPESLLCPLAPLQGSRGRLYLTCVHSSLPTRSRNHRGHHDAGIACRKRPTANPAIPLANISHPLIALHPPCGPALRASPASMKLRSRAALIRFIGRPWTPYDDRCHRKSSPTSGSEIALREGGRRSVGGLFLSCDQEELPLFAEEFRIVIETLCHLPVCPESTCNACSRFRANPSQLDLQT